MDPQTNRNKIFLLALVSRLLVVDLAVSCALGLSGKMCTEVFQVEGQAARLEE